MRILIVNADDFGLSPAVNRGIVRAHECGIVTSTSVMVRRAAAAELAACARTHPNLAFGLHCDFGEWVWREGEWLPVYTVDPVPAELERQLETFERLAGRPPTHLDSHQHVHRREPLRSLLTEKAAQLGVPLRLCGPFRYCGAFYGQSDEGAPLAEAINVDALLGILERLPEGTSELACHPAAAVDFDSPYAVERLRELDTLCDPRVRRAIDDAGIALRSFAEVAA